MSRAVLAVVMWGSRAPAPVAHPAAVARAKATLRAIRPSGEG
jgi:hypothetical protein